MVVSVLSVTVLSRGGAIAKRPINEPKISSGTAIAEDRIDGSNADVKMGKRYKALFLKVER